MQIERKLQFAYCQHIVNVFNMEQRAFSLCRKVNVLQSCLVLQENVNLVSRVISLAHSTFHLVIIQEGQLWIYLTNLLSKFKPSAGRDL